MSFSRTWPLRNTSLRRCIGASEPFSWTSLIWIKLVTTWKSTNSKRKQGSRQKQSNVSTRSRKNVLRIYVSRSKSKSLTIFNMRKRRQSSNSTVIMWSRASLRRKYTSKCRRTLTNSMAIMISHTLTETRSKEPRKRLLPSGVKSWKSSWQLKELSSLKRQRNRLLSSKNRHPMKINWNRRQRHVPKLRTTIICSTCRPNHTCYATRSELIKSSSRIRNRKLFTINSFKSHHSTPKSTRLCYSDRLWMTKVMPTQFWEMLESVSRWSSCVASKRKLKMRRN